MKKYLVIIEKSDTGYGAYVPDLPGCVATAPTKDEVERLIYEGIQFHIEGLELEGLSIPVASSEAETMVFAD
ncbi:type II toxin-antitoxin system HicB family antitoxin [Spirosoma foliorum]|uniref:Type II toxin-antitoxin system HicB family antitoxin n=1 Tax=Spirosoma foliorum TaxID=2710596 RepID=A0A7G5GT05_9BACT|nr:type II toxin-antitoxin system HicB family antitoxin [Spirosoma foliorum]QMW01997.1 type II toxin-antitoxin system HicB family antitoxin [Spirosoma foliorum]